MPTSSGTRKGQRWKDGRLAHLMCRTVVWSSLLGFLTGGALPGGLPFGSVVGGAMRSAYALASGCGNPVATGDSLHTMTVGGNTPLGDIEREYALHVPSTYDPNTPTPLVFSYHGADHVGIWPPPPLPAPFTMSWPGPIAPIVAHPRALALAPENPEGLPRFWNLREDVTFITALKNHLRATYCIDNNRIFDTGGSSGAFAANGIGCHTQASAIAAERGGILHPEEAVAFPLTPVPPHAACPPIPVLLGAANNDTVIPYDVFVNPTIDFWIENNECVDSSQDDPFITANVCHTFPNCVCRRYEECTADLVVCTWDGDHGSFEITPYEAAWWFTQVVDQYDANPQLYHEDFPAGVPTFSWNLNADTEVGFNVEYLATGHLHMGVPKESGYVYNGSEWMYVNNGRAEAQLAADYWDMPTPYDFSVGVTVTNLRYNFPEARLTVSKGEQSIEIRTFFKQKILGSPQLRAQVYVDGTPRDASWVIDRPGISRLAGGACWLLRADPITDMVTVSQRSIGTWPNCTGSWNDVVSFANPFAGLDMYDNANYPLNVSLSAWRNSVTTASADGYIRFGDVYFSRTSLGPGLP